MATPAQGLNQTLGGTAAERLLSQYGKRAYFPKGIVAQSAEARSRAKRFNATAGMAFQEGVPLSLPVIKDADRKSILGISAAIHDLATRAREGKIEVPELRGGTFTITNVGPLGGTALIPAINYPEVAILGIGKAQEKPVVREEGNQGQHVELGLQLRLQDEMRPDGVVRGGAVLPDRVRVQPAGSGQGRDSM